ncbi:MAG: hypothetical protein IKP50_05225 [Bacilli bacterium]|nr:hypothetical protein [Bacilli bacterium]
MKIQITKELPKLYYIHIRWGNLRTWGSQKTFVRMPYKKKDGTLGSKYYCSSKKDGLLFETYEEARNFENKYKTNGDIKSLVLPDNTEVREIVVEGTKCLKVKNSLGI